MAQKKQKTQSLELSGIPAFFVILFFDNFTK